MRSIVFDTGPIISLATNNLLWLLEKLKERYNGDFLIPREVEIELVKNPIETKRFKLEALQVNREINKGNLKVIEDPKIQSIKQELLSLINNCFIARNTPIRIVHEGEMAAVAAALTNNSDAIVIDERTTRELIENPEGLASLMSRKLHTKVNINMPSLSKIKAKLRGLRVIRSIELAMIGYELGNVLHKEKSLRFIKGLSNANL